MDGTPPGVFLDGFLYDFDSIKWVSVWFSFDKTKDHDGILSQDPKIDENCSKIRKVPQSRGGMGWPKIKISI